MIELLLASIAILGIAAIFFVAKYSTLKNKPFFHWYIGIMVVIAIAASLADKIKQEAYEQGVIDHAAGIAIIDSSLVIKLEIKKRPQHD